MLNNTQCVTAHCLSQLKLELTNTITERNSLEAQIQERKPRVTELTEKIFLIGEAIKALERL